MKISSEFRRTAPRLWADNSKLKRLTTWRPLFEGREDFRRGLRETIDWFSRPENLRLYSRASTRFRSVT